MIERYSREDMKKIWELENKFQKFLDVELAVCQVYTELGQIPPEALKDIEEKAKFDIPRINELERELHHDVLAFLTNVNENVGKNSRYIHMGLTSSDVLDSGLSLQLKDANAIIKKDLEELIAIIKKRALEHKNTVCIGRSHGIQAEPMTFGIKLLNWLDIFQRALKRFEIASSEILVGQISGPVGTYSNISPQIEQMTCKKLGLTPAKISTQVIARDFHANYMSSLALIASAIEQCSTEIRHLQRTEVFEVEEGFSKNQKGSSAMPHKKNPVASENLCGLARVVRANSLVALENIALWHERDISHSSTERIILPDSTILIDYMLHRFKNVVENLVVHPENMLKNANLYGGIVYSQRILLELVNKGLLREDAYRLVQKNAHLALKNETGEEKGDFKQNLLTDEQVLKYLTPKEIEECFNVNYYLSNVDEIFKRFE